VSVCLSVTVCPSVYLSPGSRFKGDVKLGTNKPRDVYDIAQELLLRCKVNFHLVNQTQKAQTSDAVSLTPL